MTAPRPMSTSVGPPRGRGPAWERPGARPATNRLTQGVSCDLQALASIGAPIDLAMNDAVVTQRHGFVHAQANRRFVPGSGVDTTREHVMRGEPHLPELPTRGQVVE